jgi:hypothetical protein
MLAETNLRRRAQGSRVVPCAYLHWLSLEGKDCCRLRACPSCSTRAAYRRQAKDYLYRIYPQHVKMIDGSYGGEKPRKMQLYEYERR